MSCLLQSHELRIPYKAYAAQADDVNSVMIDLLDLYIHHSSTTHIGPEYLESKFINLQISIRRGLREDEMDVENGIPAMRDPTAGDRGTVRFILDRERVGRESEILESLEH